MPTDEMLMGRVAAGDADALGPLFDRHHASIYALCTRLCGDDHTASDLVQEVFLRVLRFKESFRGDSSFRTWLYRIAHNACIDERRRVQSSREEALIEPDSVVAPDGRHDTSSREATLDAALSRLAPDARDVLLMACCDGLTYRQIASVVGATEGAVRVRAHRALRKLRSLVEKLEEQRNDV
ncbi:MAG TPA: RNA polymerase sigma factor [Gemmatimonadaceae bacterium]|nr:RNA polymerase sigma factor [Gemmatimonadaceae bacterium]